MNKFIVAVLALGAVATMVAFAPELAKNQQDDEDLQVVLRAEKPDEEAKTNENQSPKEIQNSTPNAVSQDVLATKTGVFYNTKLDVIQLY